MYAIVNRPSLVSLMFLLIYVLITYISIPVRNTYIRSSCGTVLIVFYNDLAVGESIQVSSLSGSKTAVGVG